MCRALQIRINGRNRGGRDLHEFELGWNRQWTAVDGSTANHSGSLDLITPWEGEPERDIAVVLPCGARAVGGYISNPLVV